MEKYNTDKSRRPTGRTLLTHTGTNVLRQNGKMLMKRHAPLPTELPTEFLTKHTPSFKPSQIYLTAKFSGMLRRIRRCQHDDQRPQRAPHPWVHQKSPGGFKQTTSRRFAAARHPQAIHILQTVT